MPWPIQDYAIIGDGRSCALISKAGSIDLLCWPRFDSEACFAALLGDERHGHWRISPAGYVSETVRRYRADTTILDTEHCTDTGHMRVTDLMPLPDASSSMIRIVEALDGEAPMAISLALRFGYGQLAPWRQCDERGLIFVVGPDRIVLDCPIDLEWEAHVASARFTIVKGAKIAFVLTHPSAAAPLSDALKVDALLEATEKESRRWIARFEPRGRWDGAIRRSLITPRTLIDSGSGGIVAAATCGLPEIHGGSAN